MDGCVHGDFTHGFARILAETPRLRKPLAITLLAPAWAAEVVSSNIVGYNKVTLQKGLNLVGSQFLNIGAGVQDIQDISAANTLPGISDAGVFQTTLRVWTGNGYTTYGWSDADDGDVEVDGETWPESNSKWLNYGMSEIVERDMPTGEGFWIKTDEAATITFAGEVPEGDSQEVEVVSGLNLISNPFPAMLNIQKIQSDDLAGISDAGAFQSTIRVWTGNGYTTYGWSDADDGDVEVDGETWPESNSKWLNYGMSEIVDVNIPIGAGFWLQTNGKATLTISK